MLTVLDFETTFQVISKNKKNPSPTDPRNYLVSAGWRTSEGDRAYRFYQHNDILDMHDLPMSGADITELQEILNRTTLLICFNAKFELMWMNAVGLKYSGKIADPFIREYVLSKGTKAGLKLEECCERYHVQLKKSELVAEYLKNNIGFEAIPMDIVEEYGLGDIDSTFELFEAQLEVLNYDENVQLWPTIDLMEEFCVCLAQIETDGIKIDTDALDKLEQEYRHELQEIEDTLQRIIYQVMGDTPINLNSDEDLSKVIYSRKVKNKQEWKDAFNIGSELRGSVRKPKRRRKLPAKLFTDTILKLTDKVWKSKAKQCWECGGVGYLFKLTVSGKPYKRPPRCKLCNASGIIYEPTEHLAGLRIVPSSSLSTAEHGFSTDKETLQYIAETTRSNTVRTFLTSLIRRSQIITYLYTFIEGIRNGLHGNNILHPQFNQCITATGRLSSSRPNFQNQPRGQTFPVRKSIVSRWLGGSILSADFRQLEFRIAGELSGDNNIFSDVLSGVDVHSATAKATGLSRQDAKPYTFAPIYGATEKGKPEHIASYFLYFKERYKGVYKWHKEMADEILSNGGYYTLPSGRTYYYPNTQRYSSGGISNSTIIANYPVQGFATGDLAIIASVNVFNNLRRNKCKSKMILQVHDDVTLDVYPGEEELCINLLRQGMLSLKDECKRRYDYDLIMPIEVELKIGPNWLEQHPIEMDMVA